LYKEQLGLQYGEQREDRESHEEQFWVVQVRMQAVNWEEKGYETHYILEIKIDSFFFYLGDSSSLPSSWDYRCVTPLPDFLDFSNLLITLVID
jgi:hypothetical protein